MLTFKVIKEQISISEARFNKKIACPSVSFPPVLTCRSDTPCKQVCYAGYAFRIYPNVKKAYNKNYQLYKSNSQKYFELIQAYLEKRQPEYFRWNVSGDIPAVEYVKGVCQTCRNMSKTKHLLFTKQYELLIESMETSDFIFNLKNLSIRISTFPGLDIPDELNSFPRAYYQPPIVGKYAGIPNENRIDWTNDIICPGKCEPCERVCWNNSDNVIFPHHSGALARSKMLKKHQSNDV